MELTWKSLYIGFEETFSYPIGNDSFWKEIHIVGILKKIFGTIFLSLWKTWLKMWISWRNPLELFKKMSKTHKNFQLFSKKIKIRNDIREISGTILGQFFSQFKLTTHDSKSHVFYAWKTKRLISWSLSKDKKKRWWNMSWILCGLQGQIAI